VRVASRGGVARAWLATVGLSLTLAMVHAAPAAAQAAADAELEARVESALASASDVPADSITVHVSDGIVTLTGSVLCDDCGGRSTPGGTGAVQQSVGALVRAVPGVERVEFRLRYGPD
jgi:hypothetical protein